MNLKNYSAIELMQMHQYSITELERRKIITNGNIISDYTAWLVTNRMQMELTHKKEYYAKKSNNQKVKIISFRNNINNKSGLVGFITDRELKFFDELIIVIYTFDFNVDLAFIIPKKVILETNLFNRNLNGYIIRVNENLTKHPNISDITHIFFDPPEYSYTQEDRILKEIYKKLKVIGKRNFVNYYEYFKKDINIEPMVNIMLSDNPSWKEKTAHTKVKKIKMIFSEKNEVKALTVIANSTNKSTPQSTKDRARELLEKNKKTIEYA